MNFLILLFLIFLIDFINNECAININSNGAVNTSTTPVGGTSNIENESSNSLA